MHEDASVGSIEAYRPSYRGHCGGYGGYGGYGGSDLAVPRYLSNEDQKLANFENVNKHIKIEHLQKQFSILKNKDEKIWNEDHILVLRKCYSKALCPDNHGCGHYCMIYMQIQRNASAKIKSFLRRAVEIDFFASYSEIRNKSFRNEIDKKLISDYNHKEYIIEYKVDNNSEMDYDQNGDGYSVRSYKKKERLGLLGW